MTTIETRKIDLNYNKIKNEVKRKIVDEQGREIEFNYKLFIVDKKSNLYVVAIEGNGEFAAECIIGDENDCVAKYDAICQGDVTPCSLRDIITDMMP